MKKVMAIMTIIVMILSMSGCGVADKVKDIKDGASEAMESLETIKDEAKEVIEEIEEQVEEVTEELEEVSEEDSEDSENTENDTDDEIRDTSNATELIFGQFVEGSLEPGEMIQFTYTVEDDKELAFVGKPTCPIMLTFREVAIDEDADRVLEYVDTDGEMIFGFGNGERMIEMTNDQEKTCHYIFVFTYGTNPDVFNDLDQLGGFPAMGDDIIDDFSNAVFELDNIDVAITGLRIFSEDSSLDLPAMPDDNYILITGDITSRYDEEASSSILYNILIFDDSLNQSGDASTWLVDGDLSIKVNNGETTNFQNLFMFDKSAKTLDLEFMDWKSKNSVNSLIDVDAFNAAIVKNDEAEALELSDDVLALSHEILELMAVDDFDAVSELSFEDGVYFIPGENNGFDTAIYIDAYQWEELNDYEGLIVWGIYAGSGEDISMTPADYIDSYITDTDFLSAPDIAVFNLSEFDSDGVGWRTSTNDVYSVRYHYSGFDEQYEGMDYQTLIMNFQENEAGTGYVLSGVINLFWTI